MSAIARPIVVVLALAALPFSGGAQERTRPAPERAEPAPRAAQPEIPSEMMPPAGKCRIWMQGVSPAQQPAPMDCKTALRQRTSNGVVVFGPTEKRAAPVPGFRSQPRPARLDTTRRTEPERTRPERDTKPSPEAKETQPRRTPTPTARPSTPPASPRRPETPSEGRPF